MGADPQVIVSDLWAAYPEALRQVWPTAQRQLCWFHVMQRVTRKRASTPADFTHRGKVSDSPHTYLTVQTLLDLQEAQILERERGEDRDLVTVDCRLSAGAMPG